MENSFVGDTNKLSSLAQYSNIATVRRIANRYKIGVVFPSTRRDKKYMVLNPEGKWIHFGQAGYEDYTIHKNLARLHNFKTRNARWKNAPTYTPAWLSYHLLWDGDM